MIGFDPLSFSPFAKGEMKKGPKNFDELNLIGGGLRSSGQKVLLCELGVLTLLRTCLVGKNSEEVSRKGFGRELSRTVQRALSSKN